jgi:tetratricopeptide (TPR) repeat protein
MSSVAEMIALAKSHQAGGDLRRAEEVALAVLTKEPGHVGALYLLGVLAWQNRDLRTAIDYLKKSVAAEPADALSWKSLGDVHLIARNLPDAVAAYQQALRLRPDYGEAANELGSAWQRLGQWQRAALCHQQAIRSLPDFAPAYDNLGNALRGQEKLAEAAEAYRQALRLSPNNPDIAYKLGITLHEMGELDQAAGYYRQVLRMRPNYADVSNSLATLLKEQGLLDEAIAQFRESLRLQPDDAMAYFGLSRMAVEGGYQFSLEDETRIRGFMASERATPRERSLCAYTLATILNKQGRYDEAFGHFREANDLKLHILKEQRAAFDAKDHEAMVDRIITAYDEAYFRSVTDWGLATELPVFIVGMPRSGSTLVDQILASHPQVFGAGEAGDVPQYIPRLAAAAGPNLYARPLLADRASAQAAGQDYAERMARLGKGAARVTIKALQNFLHLGVIATWFPRARIIHCVRDPLDICLSCYFTSFQHINFTLSLEDLGAYYRAYEKLMAHWTLVLPAEIQAVRYEELVGNQEAVTRRLLAYCGLDWDERCLTFYNTRRAVQTASSVQVRKPISTQAVGRWKRYRAHLAPLFRALGRSPQVESTPAAPQAEKK